MALGIRKDREYLQKAGIRIGLPGGTERRSNSVTVAKEFQNREAGETEKTRIQNDMMPIKWGMNSGSLKMSHKTFLAIRFDVRELESRK